MFCQFPNAGYLLFSGAASVQWARINISTCTIFVMATHLLCVNNPSVKSECKHIAAETPPNIKVHFPPSVSTVNHLPDSSSFISGYSILITLYSNSSILNQMENICNILWLIKCVRHRTVMLRRFFVLVTPHIMGQVRVKSTTPC